MEKENNLPQQNGEMIGGEDAKQPGIDSFELSLKQFVKEVRSNPEANDEVVFGGLNTLIELFVKENLEPWSDITYNSTLTKSIIAVVDISELKSAKCNEYVVRSCIRSILKLYVTEINKSRKILIKDKAKFGIQMEAMGLSVGFITESNNTRSLLPDGNVVVLSGLLALVLLLALKK